MVTSAWGRRTLISIIIISNVMHHVSAKFNYFIPKRGPDSKICIFGMYVEFSYFDAVWFFEFIVPRAFGYTSTDFLCFL
jgi:hypothetical protein